jgi:LysR family transcriptional regulator, regulator for bpeEF and oprC
VKQNLRRYPDISVELLTSSTPTSLIEEGVDIALLGGELSDSSLIAKKIAGSRVKASSSGLRAVPNHP